ncbi:unnamed protein product [Microthlaspi erraticum]|uniref:U-box domain-containing protein 12 n=1 Tax=Microthlaspi erraticum TaxID=1685480 RepID=A0A6D2HNQ1_9BRAS|nr:unnamed protein product [Microthlaspi erraticum]
MAKSEKAELAQTLIESVNEIASISDYRTPMKKHCGNLSRRLKLLLPMLEEIRDCKAPIPEELVMKALLSLKESIVHAKDLLTFVCQVSKIYLVLERDKVMLRFQKVTALLEQALTEIPYENLEISDELQEQVELVQIQLRRSIEKGGDTFDDDELYKDVLSLYGTVTDSEILRRVAKKLQLMTISDLTQESLALLEMVSSSDGDPGESFEKMSMVLKRIKDFVQTDNPNLNDAPMKQRSPLSKSQDIDQSIIAIPPEDFRCPISLELMNDPVIVSSGQTYERECIKKWLEGGHLTCPKTQETLTSDTVTPNYAIRSLIAQWCESNGVEAPKRVNNSQQSSKASASSSSSTPPTDEQSKIEELLHKLASQRTEEQRFAAGEIRLLAKQNNQNRVVIAASGAIPLLVNLLTVSDDPQTQEHAVTSLLNLSILQENKGRIVSTFGAVSGIVHVLQRGSSMEGRENAAATLFSLSVIDENKVTIGAAGAIPPLVTLLSEGSRRGKKDAATALFNLCIFQGNKGRAVRSGLVPVLMRLLTEPESRMVDEALAILAMLSSHPEGKMVVGAADDAVPVLVGLIRSGSPRNKENAAAVLEHLCSWSQEHLVEADKLGVLSLLIEMAENGTDRGKRKAAQLLNRFSRFKDQQKQPGCGVEDLISVI